MIPDNSTRIVMKERWTIYVGWDKWKWCFSEERMYELVEEAHERDPDARITVCHLFERRWQMKTTEWEVREDGESEVSIG